AVLCGVWRTWTQTPAGHRAWHRSLLSLPLVGGVRFGAASARMAHSLCAMLGSGVTIASALVFASRATADAELEHRISRVRKDVASGETLSRALEVNRAATPTVIRLV